MENIITGQKAHGAINIIVEESKLFENNTPRSISADGEYVQPLDKNFLDNTAFSSRSDLMIPGIFSIEELQFKKFGVLCQEPPTERVVTYTFRDKEGKHKNTRVSFTVNVPWVVYHVLVDEKKSMVTNIFFRREQASSFSDSLYFPFIPNIYQLNGSSKCQTCMGEIGFEGADNPNGGMPYGKLVNNAVMAFWTSNFNSDILDFAYKDPYNIIRKMYVITQEDIDSQWYANHADNSEIFRFFKGWESCSSDVVARLPQTYVMSIEELMQERRAFYGERAGTKGIDNVFHFVDQMIKVAYS